MKMKRINKAWVILFFLGGAYANEKSYLEDPLYAEGVFEEQQAMDMNNKYESLGNKLSAKESMDITNKVNEHYNNALALYIKSAEKGNPQAAWKAAGLGMSGMARQISESEASSLIEQAAIGNVVDAQLSLITDNCNVQFTECKDEKIALSWIRKAIQNKSGVAANILGFLYENGQFVERDLGKARSCYKVASTLGVVDALQNLHRISISNYSDVKNICE